MSYILTNIPNYISDQDYHVTSATALGAVKKFGGNSGNCMFWEATKKIIKNQSELELLSLTDFIKNEDFYLDKIDKVVLVLANNIGTSVSFIRVRLNYLSKLNCKKYLFSIGAQSKTLDFRKFDEDERKLYIDFLSQFEYVFLRGQYTYDLLEYNAVPLVNCEVVGCPSILLKPIDIDELKIKFEKLKTQNVDEIKLGIHFPKGHQNLKLHKQFVAIMHDPDVYTMAVDLPQMYNFVNGGKSFPIKCANEKNIEKNRNNFIFSGNAFESIKFFRNNVDLMIGTRIHGTVLGLSAGLPSMCLAIDSRTYELCEQLSIPYINCIEKSIEFYTKEELLKIFMNNYDVSKLDGLGEIIRKNNEKYVID